MPAVSALLLVVFILFGFNSCLALLLGWRKTSNFGSRTILSKLCLFVLAVLCFLEANCAHNDKHKTD